MSADPRVLGCLLLLGVVNSHPGHASPLSEAASPYLVAHAGDAIHWYPWGQHALDLARRENKLIFLSIGYASCHWCHVMARTTFADPRVSGALNRHFVNILVDRETRPDLDRHFMDIMAAMRGRRGVPANFFLTPDRVPLFAAGYLSVEAKFGEPGLLGVATSIAGAWDDKRGDLLEDAARILAELRLAPASATTGPKNPGIDPHRAAVQVWAARFDETYGGFGQQPKFPMAGVLLFLLKEGTIQHHARLLKNIYRTLDQMAAGGIRDQLGGAFHRYAVDRFWQVPHFEIMLNENALLARLYLEAYQVSGKPRYAAVARTILDDLLVRFRLRSGGFAAALDSESEGRDGRYYTWSTDDIRAVLGAQNSSAFLRAYVDPNHGLVAGRSILRLRDSPDTLLKTQQQLSDSRTRLLKARRKRTPPKRDDKVLTSWNALAVSAFAKATQVLDEPKYFRVAQEEIRHLLALANNNVGLTHSRWADKTSNHVFLDDYAFLIQALLDLYETDFQVKHLQQARRLMKSLIEKFQAQSGKPFQIIPVDTTSPIRDPIILSDDGLLSGNSAALTALARLVLYGAEADFETQLQNITTSLEHYLKDSAPAATGLLEALNFTPDKAHEIVIVGDLDHTDTQALLREVYTRLLPGTVLAVIAPDAPKHNPTWPVLSARPMLEGKSTAYVCRKRLCKLPVNTPRDLIIQLQQITTQP